MAGAKREDLQSDGWSRWYLVTESGLPRIKRYRRQGGAVKWQRYPASKYKTMSISEVETLLNQLNASFEVDRAAAESRYNFHHTYVNSTALERFERHVRKNSRIEDEHGPATVNLLNQHVFEFFIVQKNIPDPSRWHRVETEWGKWLQAKELSAGTIKRIVNTANRFAKFLVDKVYPTMDTPRKLEPVGRVVLSDMLKKSDDKSKYIKPETFDKICKWTAANRPDVLPNIILCYQFGLRISETQGLTKNKLLKNSLLIDEQGDYVLNGEIVRKTVKTDSRRVPYWKINAKETWKMIQQIEVMHPDTLIKRVNKCLKKFGHTSHDFRRTFITDALRNHHWKDVQKAVGHTDVRTTLGYDQDDRNLSDELADLE